MRSAPRSKEEIDTAEDWYEALAAELRAKKADIPNGPIDPICGLRELPVRDLNGYVLVFAEG